jgi:hypothetical protein
MFDLLAQFFQYVLDFLPRPQIVGPTEGAACYWFGRYGREKGPGIYIVWPIVQYWRTHVVVSQICETAIIAATDESGESWKWRLAIEYEICDLLKFESSSFSSQNHLEQLGGSALVSIISSNNTERLTNSTSFSICKKIRERIEEPARSRGIEVIAVRSVMAVKCMSLFVSQAERIAD